MYLPRSFRQDNMDEMKVMIMAHPFATLVTSSSHGIEANHIPLILTEEAKGEYLLRGHIARANPLGNSNVLVIFQGPNGYVSPKYYPTKKEHGKVVPTWNYVAVHVRGELTFIDDDSWRLEMLDMLTQQYESRKNTLVGK